MPGMPLDQQLEFHLCQHDILLKDCPECLWASYKRSQTDPKVVQLAALALLEPVLRLWEQDPHLFSSRPCSTCQSISAIVGRPFGCNAKKR